MLLSDLIKQLEATKTILGDFKLSEVLADRIIEMIADEKMLRDELTQTDFVGDR